MGNPLKSHSIKVPVAETSTGGSTVTKANEHIWRAVTVTEVDNAVNSMLTKAGYETVAAVDADLDVESFKKDFETGDDISKPTHAAAIKILKEKQIRYFAEAHMDVDLPTKDGVSRLMQVVVTVTAKISDLGGRFPKTIASITGIPYAGLGQDDLVAKQNALNVAATRSASELLDQLRMKGIK